MIDLDYYRKIQNMGDSTDIRMAQKYEVQENLNRDFFNTLDAYNVKINNVAQDLTIIKTNNLDTKKIKSRPNEKFFMGDIVEWMGSHWLITDVDANDDIICYGKMQECNYLLKWQDSSGNVVERWVVNTNSSSYSNGTEGNKTIVIGADQHMLLIPLDEETKKLRRDKRVMIFEDGCDPMVYKLTRPDSSSFVKHGHGYLCDILAEDALNPSVDREDLKLCDYIDTTSAPSDDTDKTADLYKMGLDCPIDEIKPGRKTTLTAQLYDENGAAITEDTTYEWTVESSIDEYITYKSNGNVLTLSLSSDCEEFGEIITITVTSKWTGQKATVELTVKEAF